MATLSDELKNEIREFLERKLREGFDDPSELPQYACEYALDGEPNSDAEAFAEACLQDVLIDFRSEQRSWPAVTDCDRLDTAFADLEAVGIVARQNFTCCGTCGMSEIGDEIDQTLAAGVNVRGYTFYHQQDTESAVEGQGLYLYYGSFEGTQADSLEIAREIQQALRQQGLTTLWTGSIRERIHVSLDWKRR